MPYERCKICDEFGWTESHECPPVFYCIYFNYRIEYEFKKVYAFNPEHAALKFAQHNYPDWDYPNSMEIWVIGSENDSWKKFSVEVEPIPHFTANRVED